MSAEAFLKIAQITAITDVWKNIRKLLGISIEK